MNRSVAQLLLHSRQPGTISLLRRPLGLLTLSCATCIRLLMAANGRSCASSIGMTKSRPLDTIKPLTALTTRKF